MIVADSYIAIRSSRPVQRPPVSVAQGSRTSPVRIIMTMVTPSPSPGRRLTAHATYSSTAIVMSEPRQKKMGRKIGADLVGGSPARAPEGADDEEQPVEGEGAQHDAHREPHKTMAHLRQWTKIPRIPACPSKVDDDDQHQGFCGRRTGPSPRASRYLALAQLHQPTCMPTARLFGGKPDRLHAAS